MRQLQDSDRAEAVEAELVVKRICFSPPYRPRTVALSGSFDNWCVRRPMVWENSTQEFAISLTLPRGRHLYKLIVDGDWMLNPGKPKELDSSHVENNVIYV
eukprot:Polyplicarium_translucidae@DN3074_c0_g2_i3.p4